MDSAKITFGEFASLCEKAEAEDILKNEKLVHSKLEERNRYVIPKIYGIGYGSKFVAFSLCLDSVRVIRLDFGTSSRSWNLMRCTLPGRTYPLRIRVLVI